MEHILTINSGSSSIKFSIYDFQATESLVMVGELSRIGLESGDFIVKDKSGSVLQKEKSNYSSHESAFNALFDWLQNSGFDKNIKAIGHRILNGGSQFFRPQIISTSLIDELVKLSSIDLEHLPQEIKGINVVSHYYPDKPQVACFDTAFHHDMPKVARLYALPRNWYDEGVLRYGFHGLSYEYVNDEFNRLEQSDADKKNVIIAHLGNGASMAAVKKGKGVDTTMGFSPTGGLVMSTRSGDLDPGVMYYLLHEKKMTPTEVFNMLNKKSGLLGVSGFSSDMKDLLQVQNESESSNEAISLFCYQVKKYLGALVAVLGGLDTLIFTGGIGENAIAIRSRICEDMDFFGLKLDPTLNSQNASLISSELSKAKIRIICTNEELMIARHTFNVAR